MRHIGNQQKSSKIAPEHPISIDIFSAYSNSDRHITANFLPKRVNYTKCLFLIESVFSLERVLLACYELAHDCQVVRQVGSMCP